MKIESKSNKTIKMIKSLSNKKDRDEQRLFVVEGEKFVNEIPDDWDVEMYVVSQGQSSAFGLKDYEKRAETIIVPDELYDYISDTQTPQGVLAVCRMKNNPIELVVRKGLVLVCEKLNDPGNLGTIVRTAASVGSGVILTKETADVFNPKTVRASAGAVFKTPVSYGHDLNFVIDMLKKSGVTTFASYLNAGKTIYEVDFCRPCAIFVGNEANGLSGYAVEMCDETIKIPMTGSTESLNASVAAGIMLYEAQRQRMIVNKL